MSVTQRNKLVVMMVLTIFILLAFITSGFTVTNLNNRPALMSPLQDGPYRLTNAIKNGDFEQFSNQDLPGSQVALHWYPYDNGGAHIGWYNEQWAEAVHAGEHSQLMEIYRVETFQPDRVMAIYQTVDVVPNMNYQLTIHALMRSDAPEPDRNQGEYAMHWGIDYQGRGKYHFVTDWIEMPLIEQKRVGSNGPSDDNTHLIYQRITGTIATQGPKLTLFIRGMKIKPTGTELNFNIDDVSLIGPFLIPTPTFTPMPTSTRLPTNTPTPTHTPTPAGTPGMPITGATLPDAGVVLPRHLSVGALVFGGLVMILLGATAANGLLHHRKK